MRLSLALKYAVQVADAVARAHGASIIHRDLKPSNIMMDEHGLVKVLDLGLAKLTEAIGPEAETAAINTGEGALGVALALVVAAVGLWFFRSTRNGTSYRIELYSLHTGKMIPFYQENTSNSRGHLRISPDGRWLLFCGPAAPPESDLMIVENFR